MQPPGNPVYPQTLHLPQAPPYTDAPPAYSEVLQLANFELVEDTRGPLVQSLSVTSDRSMVITIGIVLFDYVF